MKNLMLAGGLVLLTGCTAAYWNDRGNDLADTFTITGGTGGLVTARVSSLHAGLGCMYDYIGIRGGTVDVLQDRLNADRTFDFTFWGDDIFRAGRIPQKNIRTAEPRYVPFITWKRPQTQGLLPPFNPYYTQIECSVGVGLGLRLGFNIAEFGDLLAGFVCCDFLKDDQTTLDEYELVRQLEAAEGSYEEEGAEAIVIGGTRKVTPAEPTADDQPTPEVKPTTETDVTPTPAPAPKTQDEGEINVEDFLN